MNAAASIKQKLFELIEEMEKECYLYTRNPLKDFRRVKKWSFADVMKFIISMEGNSLKDEILKYFNFSKETPTNSSFNQRRAQILPGAFQYLFHRFNRIIADEKLFRGYRLIACDGSDLLYTHNPQDKETHIQARSDFNGYNMLHLNVLYDLLTRKYVDAIIHPIHRGDERGAMNRMVDRFQSNSKTIFIADKGYESFNNFAHVQEKGMYYLIRVKDIDTSCIAKSFYSKLPSEPDSFDTTFEFTLAHKKSACPDPAKCHLIKARQRFDFLPKKNHKINRTYEMGFRIVRFQLSDKSFECIITNLPKEEFSSDDIKELYHMRWGVETAFRELKYAVGLTNFHSKKLGYIVQEIWARLILYNFCEAVTTQVVMKQRDRCRKHTYQINFTRAIHICRFFLSSQKEAPPDLEYLISQELLPVRPGRSDRRKVKSRTAVSFLYRVA